MKVKINIIAAATVTFIALGSFGNERLPEPLVGIAKMESRTKDKGRDPGIFGDYWWANRFLSRHRLVESFRGKSVDVVLLGDSIMHFWEWKHPDSWKKLTAGRSVINLGYGGDRTQNVIWRIEHGELDGYTARYVVLMIGTNNNSSPDSRPEIVRDAIVKIVDIVHSRQPTAKVILHPIFPRGSADATLRKPKHVEAKARNDRTNVLLQEYVVAHPEVIWVDFNARLVDGTGYVPAALMADQIHPTDAGYDIWMDALDAVIK